VNNSKGKVLISLEKFIYQKIKSSLIVFRLFFKFMFHINRFRIFCASVFPSFIKLHLFKVDFLLTTRCTLLCRDCCNYIPILKQENGYDMNFTDFKLYLDNILKNVSCVDNLSFSGGEPLLNKDLDKILNYALSQKKLKTVILVTNGTLDFTDNIIYLANNNQKYSVYISKYIVKKDLHTI
jgi:MoaA/NifB/PqqE/SkfB family radical SAM enzyme